ncbi:hypothetical protein FRB90_000171 [Tulasnella sp. 427]|nr:hypothetical protein FRB90_000171 [Tulasnella sp. 427]
MAGANYMGGRGRTAKERLKDKNALKTKQHFAKSHFSAKNLNPFVSNGSTSREQTRPSFNFQHARPLPALKPASTESSEYDGGNESSSAASTKYSHTDTTPTMTKKRKTPPSKAMRELEDSEPYAHKRMKLLEQSDFAGLGKLRVPTLSENKEEKQKSSPVAPFPMVFSQEDRSESSSTAYSRRRVDAREKPPFYVRPDKPLELNGHPLAIRRPLSYETPRRTSSIRSTLEPSNQPLSIPHNSSSSPWPTSASVYNNLDSELNAASFDPLSFDNSFDEDMTHQADTRSQAREDDDCDHEELRIQDPWPYLAEQMGIELLPPRQNGSFLPYDGHRSDLLPPSERSGADYYAAFWADRLSTAANELDDDDNEAGAQARDEQCADDRLPSDSHTGFRDAGSVRIETLSEDASSTEVKFDPEAIEDNAEDEVDELDESDELDELNSDSDHAQHEVHHEDALLPEETAEIDDDPAADLEGSPLSSTPSSQASVALPHIPEAVTGQKESDVQDNAIQSSSLDIQPSGVPSSSLLSFDPTSSIPPVVGIHPSTDQVEVLLSPDRLADSLERSQTPDTALGLSKGPHDPFEFLTGLDDKQSSEDTPFNIDDILDGKLLGKTSQKLAPNPFERFTTNDALGTGFRVLEKKLPARVGSTLGLQMPSRLPEACESTRSTILGDRDSSRNPEDAGGKPASGNSEENSVTDRPTEFRPTFTHEMLQSTPSSPRISPSASITSIDGRLIGPALFDDGGDTWSEGLDSDV